MDYSAGASVAPVAGGLPGFLTCFAPGPSSQEVADSLLAGPGSALGAKGVAIGQLTATGLEVVASAGPVASRAQDLERALAEGGIVTSNQGVAVPIWSAGHRVGAVALAQEAPRTWTGLDLALLDGVTSALALWLAGSTKDDSAATQPVSGPLTPSTPLTHRQLAIIALVAEGRSNKAIAYTLGYSESTIKADLRRAMQSLGASTRAEAVVRTRDLAASTGIRP